MGADWLGADWLANHCLGTSYWTSVFVKDSRKRPIKWCKWCQDWMALNWSILLLKVCSLQFIASEILQNKGKLLNIYIYMKACCRILYNQLCIFNQVMSHSLQRYNTALHIYGVKSHKLRINVEEIKKKYVSWLYLLKIDRHIKYGSNINYDNYRGQHRTGMNKLYSHFFKIHNTI